MKLKFKTPKLMLPKFTKLFLYLSLILFVVAVSPVFSEQPKISIPEPSFHFGKVKQGHIASHQFVVKNIGSAELQIQRIVPGCGCTATNITKKKLLPNEESIITVDFDTTGFLGKKVRNVSVETNDPKMPVAILTMQGMIEADVSVKPRVVNFDEITVGETKSKEFTLIMTEGSKTKISSVSTKSQYIDVTKVREENGNQVYKVQVNKDAKLGTLRAMILVSLSDKSHTSLNIPVFASIVEKNS